MAGDAAPATACASIARSGGVMDGDRLLPKSYLDDDARREVQAESAVCWYEQESDAAEEAGDEDAALRWNYLTGNLPADVLLSLYRQNGAEWMRTNVPADWEARRIWRHDWLERSPKELLYHPAYSSEKWVFDRRG